MQSRQSDELVAQRGTREAHVSVCVGPAIIELNATEQTLIVAGQIVVLMLAGVSACVAGIALALFG